MDMSTFAGSLAVSAVAVIVAIANGVVGLRARRCDGEWSRSRYVVAAVALVIATFVFLRAASSVVGYVLLCLALVGSQLFDLLRDERARRQRVASLVRRAAAEAIPAVWVAISVASVAMLAPYVILGEQRAVALTVGLCALVMTGIGWRIASAPAQLYGQDIRYERMRDRASRSRKAGLSAVLSTGSIYAYIAFVNSGPAASLPLQNSLLLVSLFTWAGLFVWVILYSSRLERLSTAAS